MACSLRMVHLVDKEVTPVLSHCKFSRIFSEFSQIFLKLENSRFFEKFLAFKTHF